jgi:hypothetical protein
MPPLERQMLQTYNGCQMIQADVAREAWEGGMQCSQCQHANRDTAKFCEACGARLIHQCFHCGHHVNPWAKFCEECGTLLMTSTPASDSVRSWQRESESESRFYAVLPLVIGLLQRERRVSYRTLVYGFGLDAASLTEVCDELSFKQLAHDIEGKGLVWTGQHDNIKIPPVPPTATHAPPSAI